MGPDMAVPKMMPNAWPAVMKLANFPLSYAVDHFEMRGRPHEKMKH